MLIHLSEVFTCEGKKKEVPATVEFETVLSADGEVYPVLEKEPFVVTLTNMGGRKVSIVADVSLKLEIPCSRCLEAVPYLCELSIEREADLNESSEQRAEDLDEQPYINGYNLDVDRLVWDELLTGLPMTVLCKESCKGICSRCGTNLNRGTCDCDQGETNLQMSAIQDILKQFKEV
ncbi:MAG: DUF177 domain-containing protein [bacterium]|nr:DUF177 domain-containing protein [bacterium]